MFKILWHCIFVIVCVCCYTEYLTAAEDDDKVDVLNKKILSGENTADVGEAYRDFFNAASDSELQELTISEYDGLAIQASWELILRSTPKALFKQPDTDSFRLNRIELARFQGFVKGRLKVDIPAWWDVEIGTMEAKWFRRNPIPANALGMTVALGLSHEEDHEKEKPYHDTALDIEVSKDIEISAGKAGSIVLSMKGDSIAIPSSIMDIARAKETGIVSALMTDRYCYVVFPEYWPSSFEYKMWCIDRRSGEINWSTEVFGPVDGLSTSGFQQSPHYVSIVAKQGKVYVFGGTPESMYIEAFSAETGKGVFRFCTLY